MILGVCGREGQREFAENTPRVALSMGEQNVRISQRKSMILGVCGCGGQREFAENTPRVALSMGEQNVRIS